MEDFITPRVDNLAADVHGPLNSFVLTLRLPCSYASVVHTVYRV